MAFTGRRNSARVLLVGVGLACLLGHARPALADEPKPAAPDEPAQPKIFEGLAGVTRSMAWWIALCAAGTGIASAVESSDDAAQAAELAAPLQRDFGLGACRNAGAAKTGACANLAATMADRDKRGDWAVGTLVFAGVLATTATASIWFWRTPGQSWWLPDLLHVTPTAGPKSGGVVLQGSW
jgi:hypothetical protein